MVSKYTLFPGEMITRNNIDTFVLSSVDLFICKTIKNTSILFKNETQEFFFKKFFYISKFHYIFLCYTFLILPYTNLNFITKSYFGESLNWPRAM